MNKKNTGRLAPVALVISLTTSILFPTLGSAETLVIGGTGGALAAIRLVGDAYQKLHPDIKVIVPKSLGSGGGIKAVLKGKIDIGLSGRALKKKELNAGAVSIAYARSPFLLGISGVDHADTKLSSKDIEAIYSRRQKKWGNGYDIRFVFRPASDSDTVLLLEWFPNLDSDLAEARKRRGAVITETDQTAMDTAERVKGSITTATLSAIVSENRDIHPITIDGVAPTLENVRSGQHKWFKEFLLVTGKVQSDKAKAFISFIRSAAGQKILESTGNVAVGTDG